MAAVRALYGRPTADGIVSTIDNFLKKDYVMKRLVDTVNMQTYFLSRVRREKTQHGEEFEFSMKYGVGEGQGNRKEYALLPEPGFPKYNKLRGNVRYQYNSMSISGPAIAASSGGMTTSYASAFKEALKGCRDGMKLDTHRQSWGLESGAMGLVNGAVAAAGTEITVDSIFNLTYQGTLDSEEVFPHFRPGMNLVFKSTADPAVWRTGQVKQVKSDGKLVLTKARVAAADDVNGPIADNSIIFRGDTETLNDEGLDFVGVAQQMAQTGTYFGADRADFTHLQFNVLNANGNALSETLLHQALDFTNIYGDGNTKPNILISNHKLRRRYVRLLRSYKRYTSPKRLRGGYDLLDFQGHPWEVDKRCPGERVFFLNTGDICWFVMGGVDNRWIAKDGSVLYRTERRDAYEATIAAYKNMCCIKPLNQTVLYGLNESLADTLL